MDVFRSDRIRNVVLLGHGGAGKTSLVEAMAFLSGITNRLGKVLASVLRGLISSAIILVLAFVFGAEIDITPLFLVVLILNCIIFSEIGLSLHLLLC